MQKQFFGAKQEILLEANFDIDKVVVFLPGISGKAHSERFAGLAKVAEDAGYACARLKIWDDEAQVQAMTYNEIFAKLDELLGNLKQLGFIEAALVGKSFGGGVALMYEHEMVTQKILWSPAIGVSEDEGNVLQFMNTKLGEIANLLDVIVGETQLSAANTPTSIIHGTGDALIPYRNSEIMAQLSGASLTLVEGADHSFKDPFHEGKLLELTGNLLQ